jgi:uncharacterized membrane protein YgcG
VLCPYCQARLRETDPECANCGISLEKADALLGAVPRLVGGLSDGAKLISRSDSRRILKQLRETHILFPQVEVSVVTLDGIPPGVNLQAYTFWLFNRSDVVRRLDSDGRNYDILLTIDASGSSAAMIVGYGLEPLVGPRHIRKALEPGRPHLTAGAHAAGILVILESLKATLKEVATGTPAAFALPEAPIVKAKSMTEASLDF